MSKELTPLEQFYYIVEIIRHHSPYPNSINKYIENVENMLKALEIIKNKKVNVNYLFSREVNDYIDYNVWSGCENLTAEEYELLKEILK